MVRVGILGMGGIGGWLGARLVESEEAEVVFIARGAHGSAIKEKGLCLVVKSGAEAEKVQLQPKSAEVYATVAEAIDSGCKLLDFMILGVKTWQVREAAAEVAPLLSEGGCVVVTQNGVEAPADAKVAVGSERVLVSVCKVLSFISAPGQVEMKVFPASVQIGEAYDEHGLPRRQPKSDRVELLLSLFAKCKGVTSGLATPNCWVTIWEKAIMSSIFSVAAACRAPFDKLLGIPETRALVEAAMLEVGSCAVAGGHVEEPKMKELIETSLGNLSKAPPGTTPSTLRDIVTGKPSEIRELLGGIKRAGVALSVPTPVHDMLLATLLPQELRARGEQPYELMGVPGGAPHVSSSSQ